MPMLVFLLIIVVAFTLAALVAFGLPLIVRDWRTGRALATLFGGFAYLGSLMLFDALNPSSGFKTVEGALAMVVTVFAVVRLLVTKNAGPRSGEHSAAVFD